MKTISRLLVLLLLAGFVFPATNPPFAGAIFSGPSLDVTTPDVSGTALRNNQSYTIRWTLMNYTGFGSVPTTLSLRQRSSNGSSTEIRSITTNASSRSGSNEYTWTIPSDLSGNNYRFAVKLNQSFSNEFGTSYYPEAESRDFSINSSGGGGGSGIPNVEVLSPDGGEVVSKGSSYSIRWRVNASNSFDSYRTVIKLFRSGDEVREITSDVTSYVGDNSFQWFVPTSLDNDDRYRIKVRLSGFSGDVQDESDSNFRIVAGGTNQQVYIDSISPSSGPTGRQVTLYGNGFNSNNDIRFGNGIIEDVFSSSSTSLTFTVPSRIRCSNSSSCNGQTFYDVLPGDYNVAVENGNGFSNSVSFRVTGGSSGGDTYLLVETPNGGESYNNGNQVSIRWQFDDGINNSASSYRTRIVLLDGGSEILTVTDSTFSSDGTNSFSWNIPTYLAGTDYRIRISIDDNRIDFADDISNSSFEIRGNGNNNGSFIRVTRPNGGENLQPNQFYSIEWDYQDGRSSSLSYRTRITMLDANQEVLTVTDSATSHDGSNSYSWLVPNNFQGSNYKIRIQMNDSSVPFVQDQSDGTFSINGNGSSGVTVRVQQPNGGEFLSAGQSYQIRWFFDDGTSGNNSYRTRVMLMDGNSEVLTLTSNAFSSDGSDNSYTWSVPGNYSGNNFRIKVQTDDSRIATVSDQSDSTFRINQGGSSGAFVQVITPNGGQVWRQGDTQTIEWTFNDGLSSSNLGYRTRIKLLNGFSEVAEITSNTTSYDGTNRFTWLIPSSNTYQGNNFRIRVQSDDSRISTVSDESDNVFSINTTGGGSGNSFIRVQQPNGGESLSSGQNYDIRWSFDDGISGGNVGYRTRIILLDGNSEVLTIANNATSYDGSSNSYTWFVSNNYSGNNFRIKVQTDDNRISTVSDQSDSTFRINQGGSGNASLQVVTPNGGQFWRSGDTQTIEWTFNDGISGSNVGYRTRIKLLNGFSETAEITSNTTSFDGTNRFNWSIPTSSTYQGSNFRIRIETDDSRINTVSDQSDNTFMINASSGGGSGTPIIDGVSGPSYLNLNETGTFSVRARDPENGSLSYRVQWGDEGSIFNDSVLSSSFNQTATFTHSYNRSGVFLIKFSVTDSQGLTANASLTVNVGTTGNGNNNRQIEIRNFTFSPSTITVPLGTTVIWINRDSSQHTVVGDNLSFQSGILSTDQSYRYTFNQTGTFTYHCSIHPSMTGTIVVTNSNDGGGNIPLPPAGFEDEVLVNNNSFANPFRDTNLNTLEGMAAAELYRRAVVGGFPDGEFKPSRLVNRAEGSKFLLLTRYSSVSDVRNNGRFPDVLENQWYTKFVITAANLNIVNGYPDGTFRPQDGIKRAEFLKMMTLTFGLSENLSYNFNDVHPSDWFARYAGTVQRYNLIPDIGSSLFPERTMTRGEVAVAIYEYLLHRNQ